MNCLICNFETEYYFSKHFAKYNLENVDYWKCKNCGLVFSKTHKEMKEYEWGVLNISYHKEYLGSSRNEDDLNWLNRLRLQTNIILDLVELGILDSALKWLDYGCGDGKLSEMLSHYNINLQKYDKHMPIDSTYINDEEIIPFSFDLVLTTSVFEHIFERNDLDIIEGLVNNTGILGLHTLVAESIPNDPEWFYLLPVHTTFYTNKSMQILFESWNYKCSIYNIESRLWFWFKENCEEVQKQIHFANSRNNKPTYLFKNGFMNYWK